MKREIGQDWKLGNMLPLVGVIINHNPQCRCPFHKQHSCPQGKGFPNMQGWLTPISAMEHSHDAPSAPGNSTMGQFVLAPVPGKGVFLHIPLSWRKNSLKKGP